MSERRARRTARATVTRAHVALAGNPNVGKSSLCNQLTGSHQHVANWPGKTVERHVGVCVLGDIEVEVIDLPGTYSLAGTSPEEQVAAEALTDPSLDAVVVVLDSTNLERNLYLAAQVAELGRPMIVVLNLTDAAARDGFVLDDAALGRALGAPVVRTVARTGAGLDELRASLAQLLGARSGPRTDADRPAGHDPAGEALDGSDTVDTREATSIGRVQP